MMVGTVCFTINREQVIKQRWESKKGHLEKLDEAKTPIHAYLWLFETQGIWLEGEAVDMSRGVAWAPPEPQAWDILSIFGKPAISV